MSFLAVLCEGYTEIDFVQQVLSEHLASRGTVCHAILLGKRVTHDVAGAPGGIHKYEAVYKHLNAAMRQHLAPSSFVTTMMDFYAFPRDFPNYEALAAEPAAAKRVALFEDELFNHSGRNARFIPYIQLHELEALIYARLEELRAEFENDTTALRKLDELIASVRGVDPEEVNQTKDGAPSKRLLQFLPYQKRAGARIVKQIGWAHLKATCPHSGAWIQRLESL